MSVDENSVNKNLHRGSCVQLDNSSLVFSLPKERINSNIKVTPCQLNQETKREPRDYLLECSIFLERRTVLQYHCIHTNTPHLPLSVARLLPTTSWLGNIIRHDIVPLGYKPFNWNGLLIFIHLSVHLKVVGVSIYFEDWT